MFKRIINYFVARRDRAKAKILASPFPEAWVPIVVRAVPQYPRLSAADRRHLRDSIQVFLAEKSFLGCRGLVITDEIRVTVAAGACLMLLGLPELDVFPRLREIIVYPHDLSDVVDAVGPDGTQYSINLLRGGEAWRRGPVLIAWNNVSQTLDWARDGYNLVLHEFAHVLDMQNGEADGIPPLPSREMIERWSSEFFDEYRQFVAANRRGEPTFLNPYGVKNPAEFFALATEQFFEEPAAFREARGRLFQLLVDFFGRDPRKWLPEQPLRWFRRIGR